MARSAPVPTPFVCYLRVYEPLVDVAKRKTAVADTELDDRGKKLEAAEEEFGENVLIVNPEEPQSEELV